MPSLRPSLSTLPSYLTLPSRWTKWKAVMVGSLNFYRIHLLTFTVVPFITSGIMYACNTEYHIAYIDCLFCCMSAMTVTGLATVDLSTLSPFQQVILFLQMIIGSLSFVSIVMILVRQYFFRQAFKHVLQERERRRSRLTKTITRVATTAPPILAIRKRFGAGFRGFAKGDTESKNGSPDGSTPSSLELKAVSHSPKKAEDHKHRKKGHQKLHPDMIKRVEGGGVGLINPMGWYDAERAEIPTPAPTPEHRNDMPLPSGKTVAADGKDLSQALEAAVVSGVAQVRQPSGVSEAKHKESKTKLPEAEAEADVADEVSTAFHKRDRTPTPPPSPRHHKIPYAGLQLTDEAFPRSKTIAFEDAIDDSHDHRERGSTTQREGGTFPRTATFRNNAADPRLPYSATMQSNAGNFPRTYSLRPMNSHRPDARMEGFGGFPTPLAIGKKVFRKIFPETSKTLSKTFTVSRTNTLSGRSIGGGSEGKDVPYISFAATIGRNSRFQGLTTEQMDELGGVEYRALRVLLYIVVGYVIFMPLAAFVIIAPYISAGNRYDYVFDEQPRVVGIPWFSLFQSISAFTNTGMSLCDTSMLPFQKAYLMIVVMIILIFAGNTAFPVFLRCTVWVIYKCVPESSRVRESLKFLLDHPRRCFVYLFPSTQTWVLALVMLSLTLIDWVSFLVLDLGTEVIMSIPVGTRIAAGFLQSAAVRAAGFSIVPLAELAPAVKVLYVVMMYISVYPIALSVRSTNVYEEKSLGLFGDEVEEDVLSEEGSGAHAVAKYIGWHARRQLAFDIWWLAFALWLVCIIERGHIDNDQEWFNIFNILFELVSAYATVGLSLGVPYDNYSFCGGFRKLSKLVVIIVMLRGRHRGLPVAIDRAVMLPKDFTAAEETAFEEERSRRASRMGSMFNEDVFGMRRDSFNRISSPQEMSSISGPASANAVHDQQHGGVQFENPHQHRRSSSLGPTSPPADAGLFNPSRETSGEDRWPPMGLSGGLTPVREMSRRPIRKDYFDGDPLEV
ncbi:potassium ion transporter [Cryptococcus deuterogattii R265]|uniref:Potassium transport protein n=1 Tax=Cryptococcus deuterogattii (strain R265) TaxID=294750 RepID=A0A095CDV8_CRYD2|nr:potassium ion transporter [Cryptococcus deuterogattii R265]KIR74715.1 potassium ion transporter [Cryptococcus deuterogattii CA1014]